MIKKWTKRRTATSTMMAKFWLKRYDAGVMFDRNKGFKNPVPVPLAAGLKKLSAPCR